MDNLIKTGILERKIGKTDMNVESSRSHLIITIQTEFVNKSTSVVSFLSNFAVLQKTLCSQELLLKIKGPFFSILYFSGSKIGIASDI